MVKSWCAFVAFVALIASTNGRIVVFEAGSGESLVFTSGDDAHAYRSEPWEGHDGGFSTTNLHEGPHGASRGFAPLFHPVDWLLQQVEAVEAAREVMLLDMLMGLKQPLDATSEDPSSSGSLLLGAWKPDVESRQQAAQLPDFTLIEEFPSRGSLDEQPPWLAGQAASKQLPQQQRPAGDPFGDSPEAMLRHVGCQRFRGAMHDYMQAASQDTIDAAIMASGVHGMMGQQTTFNGGDDSDASLAYANADPLTVTHLDLEQLLQLRDEMDADSEGARATEQYVYEEALPAVGVEGSSVSEVQEGSLLDQLMAAAFGASTEELGLPRSTTEQDLAEAVLYLNQQELYQDHDSYYEDPSTWGDLNADARSDVVDLVSQPFDYRPQEDTRLVVVMGGREDSDAAVEDDSADAYSESALQLEEAVEQLAQQQQDAADEDIPRQNGGSRDWSSVINTPFYEASETEIYNGVYDREYMDTAEDAFVTYMHTTEGEASHPANPAVGSSSGSGRDADVAGQLLISSIISALVGGSSSRSYGSAMAMASTDSREPEVLPGPYTHSTLPQRPVQQQQARGLDIDGDGAADIDLALFDRNGQLNTPLLTLLGLLLAGAATAVWSVHSFMQLRDAMLGRGGGNGHVMVPVMVEHNGKLVRGMVMVPRDEVEEDEECGKGKGKGEFVVEKGVQQQQAQQQEQWGSGVVIASEYAKLPGGDV